MPQRKQIRWSQLKVGLVSLTSLTLLAIVIFLVTGETGFFAKTISVRTYSPDAGGLKTGAVVRLAGVDVGSVRRVTLSGSPDLSQAVEVVMEVAASYSPDLRADSEAVIAAEGLLGERYVNITRGTASAPPIADGGVVPFRHTAEFSELVGGSRDLIDNLNVLTVRLNSIVETIELGQGTVGKLISDDSLYRRLDATVNNAEKLVSSISGGQGSLGRLITSEELYDHASVTLAKLESAVSRIESAEGTIGKLIQDPSLYHNAEQMVANASLLVDNINQGKGTLGKMATDEELYRRFQSAVSRLETILEDARTGQGTLGRLFQDPTLYNNLNSTSAEVRELIADFRKNPKQFLTIQLRIF